MTDIRMPQLSDSMEQGTILSWLKSEGEEITVGDELLEIETDKSTVPYQAEAAGFLEIIVAEGDSVPIGETIGRLADAPAAARSATSVEPSEADATHNGGPTPSADADVAEAAGEDAAAASGAMTGNGAAAPAASHGAAPGTGTPAGSTAPATPVARRVAAAHGISLSEVAGTGPLGRITRGDVLAKAGIAEPPARSAPAPAADRPAAAPPAPAPTTAPSSTEGELVPMSRLQRLIAERMTTAKAAVPHFQVQTEVAMDAALALRAQLKAVSSETLPPPSVNDLIVKAAALALREHPLGNGSYTEAGFQLHDQINVGIAVAAQDALVVPVIRDAAGRSLGEVAREARRLAGRVRSGEISPADLDGGTFTVSNLGMFGMTAISPVINPPQAAILGVGAARAVLAREGEEIVERQIVTLTLSCDHRILYGADAAKLLATIRERLETPLSLAL